MEAPVLRPQSAPVAVHGIELPRSPVGDVGTTTQHATAAAGPADNAVTASREAASTNAPKTPKSKNSAFKNLFKRNNKQTKAAGPVSTAPTTSEPVTMPETPGTAAGSFTRTQEELAALPVYGPENKNSKRRAFKTKASKFSKKTGRGLKVLGRGIVMVGAGVLGVIGTIIIAPLVLVGGALFVIITTVAGIVCCPCIAVGTAIYAVNE